MTGLKPQLSVSSKHLEVKEALAQESGNVGSSLGFPLTYRLFYVPWVPQSRHLDMSRLDTKSSVIPSDFPEVSYRSAAR